MAIHISELAHSYSGSLDHTVLNIAEWRVQQGEHVFLHGPSGSGKSTLLNLLAGILLPTSGSVDILGTPLSTLSARQRDQFRARHVGVVFQQFNLVPYLSVLDNISLAAHFGTKAISKVEDGERSKSRQQEPVHSRAARLLAQLQLDEQILAQRADSLSVGQQQRVAIVRALINDPALLIADEPTSALDSDARDLFIELLLSTAGESKRTLLFVSHDRALAGHFSTSVALNELNQTHTEGRSNAV